MSDAASPPIYQQIAGMLRREIAGGQLVVGQPLAPERQLAKQFGVSVVTLRKADPEDAWLTLASTEVAGNYF